MQRNPSRTIAYGEGADQVADLYLPAQGAHAPIVCLIHGGFWRARYGRDTIAPLAVDLAARGFAVWNLEYRRVGSPGGGWPGTFEDVGRGIDRLAGIAEVTCGSGVTVIGHSAGGHLALWCAHRHSKFGPRDVRIAAVVGLAPVTDLAKADELNLSRGAVKEFLGDGRPDFAERRRSTSPIELLPLRVPQLLIHGTHDEDVPVQMSREYAIAAQAAGDSVEFIELPDATHMDLVDPRILRRCGLRHFAHHAGDFLPDIGAAHSLL